MVNPISSIFFSFFFLLVELMCLVVNDGGGFYLFFLQIWPCKTQELQESCSMLIHGGLTFKI